MKTYKYIMLLLSLNLLSFLYSQVPFNTTPDWISTDNEVGSTGGVFADINQDGWLDFVISGGNKDFRRNIFVYYNTGTGVFNTTSDWQSEDVDYHGHLDVGDVNADGYPDVAVSVYLGPNGIDSPGRVKLYLNNGGTLSSLPYWTSGDSLYTFSCAFGDADGDGYLDLPVAGGAYNPGLYKEALRIYYNRDGMLEEFPSWKSQNVQYSYDVNWADFDNDGDLDLVFAGIRCPDRIFENFGDSVSTIPTWQSTDYDWGSNSLFIGDVNDDKFLDLTIADNLFYGVYGKFKIYFNNLGIISTVPLWSSYFGGWSTAITLADINNDLRPDLIGGARWDSIRIYLNNSGIYDIYPDYTSSTKSVIEAVFCGDVDNDGVESFTKEFISNGVRKLFYFPRTPLQYLNRVFVGQDTLGFDEYCYDLENGWLMLAEAPDSGLVIYADIAVSWDIDMGLTNWDNIGNYIFFNTTNPVISKDINQLLENLVLLQNYPNPFNPNTKIKYTIPNVIASGTK